MIVSRCKYIIEVLALHEDKNYLIEVTLGDKKRHVTVGPRDSLSQTIRRIQRELENGGDT